MTDLDKLFDALRGITHKDSPPSGAESDPEAEDQRFLIVVDSRSHQACSQGREDERLARTGNGADTQTSSCIVEDFLLSGAELQF